MAKSETNVVHFGSWCSQCGPDVRVDEDACCVVCGLDAIGFGADQALRTRDWVAKQECTCQSGECEPCRARKALEARG